MTTLQNIIKSIQNANLLPIGSINGGITNGAKPPYIGILDYQHTVDYDTGGFDNVANGTPAYAILEATFRVLVLHTGCDAAETLAAQVDQVLNLNRTLTPQSQNMPCIQTGYKSSQMDAQLYQWGVEIEYKIGGSF